MRGQWAPFRVWSIWAPTSRRWPTTWWSVGPPSVANRSKVVRGQCSSTTSRSEPPAPHRLPNTPSWCSWSSDWTGTASEALKEWRDRLSSHAPSVHPCVSRGRGNAHGCTLGSSFGIGGIPAQCRYPVGDLLLLVISVQMTWRLRERLIRPTAHHHSVLGLSHRLDDSPGPRRAAAARTSGRRRPS